jgi:predicted nucleic acid-binding protein
MRRFFDTNVLVYMFDGSEPQKKRRAQELLRQAVADGAALLSTQVLQEFFVAVTRKLSIPLRHQDAERAVRDLAVLPLIEVDAEIILRAIATMQSRRLSFWDALIVESALRGGATVLYTEDLNHGERFGTLVIENPFRPELLP